MNPLYLRINHVSRYIEEINENKCLIFESIDENKELVKNTMIFLIELWLNIKK